MNKKHFFSLKYKLILMLTLSFIAGMALFFSSQFIGDKIINNLYMSQDKLEQRVIDYHESLQTFVTDNGVSIKDTKAISMWVSRNKYVYLTIYDGNRVIYESGWWDDDGLEEEEYELEDLELEDSFSEKELEYSDVYYMKNVKFAEGVYTASIIEFTEERWYDLVYYISWAVFLLTMVITLIVYSHKLTGRITRLSQEVASIEGSTPEKEISSEGNDEISILADNIMKMNSSIIKRLKSESEAWESNSELITSMSHDIRTPLTSLIGYLDIIESKGYYSQEQLETYIKNSQQKAIQLKNLSDKLFQYFLIFGKEKIEMNNEAFDLTILLQQLIGERSYYLMSLGFDVAVTLEEKSVIFNGDIYYISRLFDNLFSNIEKYADKNKPVIVTSRTSQSYINIGLSNGICRDREFVESTNIGLKTCKKIVEQMNGKFEVNSDQESFSVDIKLPI